MNKLDIKGVLFDKDGTLIDFKSIWIPITCNFVEHALELLGVSKGSELKNEVLTALGITYDDIDPNGIAARGTMDEVNEAFAQVLIRNGIEYAPDEETYRRMSDLMFQLVRKYGKRVTPVGDLHKLLRTLKESGLYIGIATSDLKESAEYCMKKLGVLDYFDYIGGEDGIIETKPHPELMNIFCEEFGLRPEEVAVVGDTTSDMLFAQNSGAGLAIGVLCGVGSRENLEGLADIICPSTMDIIAETGEFIWENERAS